ncbi:MAG TPA: bis(5'-nucleosyl)-tetraphosphatase (symmetrical) YqeK [Spirochaetia bacterium]|nr:bis(5'-nucleosyl)-tetraphosphatase (symmetrical) YqeK [Spirochaetia bacterium]
MNTYRTTGSTRVDALLPMIDRFLKRTLSGKRYAHSRRVAQLCKAICCRYRLDPTVGCFVGLTHDLAREWSDEDLVELSQSDGEPFLPIEKERPLLLHGRACALFLAGRFGVYDPEVLEAVRYHTFGRSGYCDHGKALFLSDYLEPGRNFVTGTLRDSVLALPLNAAVRAIIDHAESRGKSLAEPTRAMYDELALKK